MSTSDVDALTSKISQSLLPLFRSFVKDELKEMQGGGLASASAYASVKPTKDEDWEKVAPVSATSHPQLELLSAGDKTPHFFDVIDGAAKVRLDGSLILLRELKGDLTHLAGLELQTELKVNYSFNGVFKIQDRVLLRQSGEFSFDNGSVFLLESNTDGTYKGTCTDKDGAVFVGTVDSKTFARQKGSIVFKKTASKFEGTWSNDAMKSGTFTFANGAVYEGEFLENQLHGKGKLILSKTHAAFGATSYEGEFLKGEFHGSGTLTGPRYNIQGTFEYGYLHGEAKLIDKKNALTYDINAERGVLDNKASVTYQSGNKTTGILSDETRSLDLQDTVLAEKTLYFFGPGRKVFSEKSIYSLFEGSFVKDNLESGQLTFKDGSWMAGKFLEKNSTERLHEGQVCIMPHQVNVTVSNRLRKVVKYADGATYVGGIQNNRRHGRGTLTLPGGSVVYGHWFEDALVVDDVPIYPGETLQTFSGVSKTDAYTGKLQHPDIVI